MNSIQTAGSLRTGGFLSITYGLSLSEAVYAHTLYLPVENKGDDVYIAGGTHIDLTI